jgi:hypothetical protein
MLAVLFFPKFHIIIIIIIIISQKIGKWQTSQIFLTFSKFQSRTFFRLVRISVCFLGPRKGDCLFAILWCFHIGNHSQANLATFGYRPAMNVIFFNQNPFIF